MRLKARIYTGGYFIPCEISIPFGAIKSLQKYQQGVLSVMTFQFLLVRLKDVSRCVDAVIVFVISIPFGAIKSRRKHKNNRNKRISIPFGAIKSPSNRLRIARVPISIPFGAIKSERADATIVKSCISIPFGAIKRNLQIFASVKLILFQFLLVRLKAIRKCIYRRICEISIPFGAIKSKRL